MRIAIGHSQGTKGFRINNLHLPSLNPPLTVPAGHGESKGHDPLLATTPLAPVTSTTAGRSSAAWGVSLRWRIKSTGGKSLGTNSSGSSMTARAIFGGCQR